MTKVSFAHIQKSIVSFDMRGHCDFKNGDDIVCAAVSSAAYLVANTITDEYHLSADIELDENSGGFFFLSLALEDAKLCQELLQGFKHHLEALAEQYPKNISIINTNIN